MDKKLANNIIVGIFVAVGFGIFIFMVFSMGDGRGIFSRQMTFYGRFQEVKGLHQGSEVSLNGLRIGVVRGISVDPETRDLIVTMTVDKTNANQIKSDTVAMVRTQGMLGDKYIELSIGSVGEPLKNEVFIPTGSAPDIFSKGGNFVDELSQHFTKGGNVDKLLLELSLTAQNLSQITSSVQKGKSADKLDKSLLHMESILAKIDNGEGTLGALVNDPSLYEDVKVMMGGAKRSSILKYFMRSFSQSGSEVKEEKK